MDQVKQINITNEGTARMNTWTSVSFHYHILLFCMYEFMCIFLLPFIPSALQTHTHMLMRNNLNNEPTWYFLERNIHWEHLNCQLHDDGPSISSSGICLPHYFATISQWNHHILNLTQQKFQFYVFILKPFHADYGMKFNRFFWEMKSTKIYWNLNNGAFGLLSIIVFD